VTITVNPASAPANQIPLHADAGSDQTITLPVSTVKISGISKSTAPEGSVHVWSQASGPKTATILYPKSIGTDVTGLTVAGTYKFQLTITDPKGNVATSTVTITVNPAPTSVNQIPLYADAGSDQTITLPVSTVKISGISKSTAPEGSVHVWTQASGPKTATILYPKSIGTDVTGLTVAGTYKFQLTITDPKGNVASSTVTITVNAAASTIPLHADAGSDQTITLPVSTVKISGISKSTAPEGSVHVWTQASGPKTATILYPKSIGTDVTGLTVAGTYKFQLTITDPKGNVAASTVTITVKAAASARTMAGSEANNIAQDQSLQLAVPDMSSAPAELEVKVNPNPVQSDMTIWINGMPKGKTSVTIYNLNGQVLLQQEFVKDAPGIVSKTFNVSKLAPGTYIGQIIVDNKYKKAIKILKQ
jgi:hypothetical protein